MEGVRRRRTERWAARAQRSAGPGVRVTMGVLGVLFAVLSLPFFLLASLYGETSYPSCYLRQWEKLDIAEASGVAQEDLPLVADALVAALRGDAEALAFDIPVHGVRQPAFGEREQLHMRDVIALMRLSRSLLWGLLAGVLALCAVAYVTGKRRGGQEQLLLGMLWGSVLGFAAAAALALWAWHDFAGSFAVFHELLFTNDLWLLDPDTELLIRLFPQRFFMNIAWDIARRWVLGMMAWIVFLLILWLPRVRRRRGRRAGAQ